MDMDQKLQDQLRRIEALCDKILARLDENRPREVIEAERRAKEFEEWQIAQDERERARAELVASMRNN